MISKRVICSIFLSIAAMVLILSTLSAPAALCQVNGPDRADYHNQRGIEYFKKGFYDHTPKNQAEDAERSYGLAETEFQEAVARDPFLTDAHRNLARLYYVQKNFRGAADEYKRVTELTPGDVDAYVNLALSLTQINKYDEAIQALKNAKQQTSDPKALKTLDEYISRALAHQTKEVR